MNCRSLTHNPANSEGYDIMIQISVIVNVEFFLHYPIISDIREIFLHNTDILGFYRILKKMGKRVAIDILYNVWYM